MVCSNMELAAAEIMAEDLQTHTNGYHLDIPGPYLTIQNLIKLYHCPAKLDN